MHRQINNTISPLYKQLSYVPPAEDTLVGTCETGCGLHAPMALNAIEGVFVTASPPTEHGLGPATQLHP